METGNSGLIGADDARTILTTRVFEAPRALVFEAWSDPIHLANWWGPDGFSTTTRAFDFRPGGVWRFVMHGPDGRDYQNRVTYDEIEKPVRLVYRHGGGEEVELVRSHVTVTFEELGDKTKVEMRMVFPTAAERDHVAREYKAVEGGAQTMARLASYLPSLLRS
jgi:uncharacterized protein YndB with AHSA1/START domain